MTSTTTSSSSSSSSSSFISFLIDHDDFYVPPYFVYGVITAFIGVFITFHLMKSVIIPNFTTEEFQLKLLKMKRKDQNFFYITLPSMIHSLAHSLFHPMLISMGYSLQHTLNRVTYFDDKWPAFFQGIFVGYLLADFIVLGPIDLGPMYVIHHISAISIWTWSTCLGAMQWYGSCLEFAEFSTIFLNIRQWILTSGYSSSSTASTISSLLFFTSFFYVRVISLPTLVIQWINEDYNKLAIEKGQALAIANSLTLAIHVLLQSFWFFLMVKKIVTMITGGGSSGSSSKSKSKTKKEE